MSNHKLFLCSLLYLLVSVAAIAQESIADAEVLDDIGESQTKLSELTERFEVGEDLIVTVRVGSFNYGEVFAIVSDTGLFVSPEELIGILDFPISRMQNEQTYSLKGWFINEQKTFEMRLFDRIDSKGIGEVIVEGKRQYIPAEQFMELGAEKLVNFDLVGSWFGLSLTFDNERLSVNAIASTPLPAQAKEKREKARLDRRGHLIPKHPNFDFGYFDRSHQLFDASISSFYRNDNFNNFYSVVGIQDIAGYSTRFFVRGSEDDPLQSANLNFKRQSINSDLLGPLNATTFEFGDIRPTRFAGVTGGESLGISINNEKLGQAYDFEFTNITGVIQEGWDVELYQNGVLTRKALNTSGGQYEFLDLPLFAALNRFEIVKYGPQGQIERESVEKNLDNQTFSDTARYNVSLRKANSSLLLDKNNANAAQDIFLTGTYAYTFLPWLSTNFSHNVNLSDSSGVYSLGAAARLSPRVLSSFSFAYLNSEQQNLGFSLQSALFDQFVNVSANRSFSANDDYADSLALKMAGNIFEGKLVRLSYSNDLNINRQKNGDFVQILGNTLTFSSRYGFLSHNYNHRSEAFADIEETFTSGGITLGGARGNFNTRLNANYEKNAINDEFSWLGASASFNYEFYEDLSSQFEVSRSFASEVNSYNLSLQWQKANYSLFGSVTHNSNNDTSFSLNARFSMAEAPFGQGYVSSGRTLTGNALVAVRVYEDVNQNFIFDEEDRALPEVKVSAQQLARSAISDEYGIAMLEGINSFRQTDLEVDLETLDDPYLLQSTITTSLTPRGGLLSLINYPFVQGIEFEGEFKKTSAQGDSLSTINNAPIQIYGSNGELVKTVRSEFDGYFYSGVLFPDTYTLKVDETFLKNQEIAVNQITLVDAQKAGSFVADVQIKGESLNLEDHFQAYIGEFSTEGIAKMYLKMFQDRYAMHPISGMVTLHQSQKTEKYYVGFSFYKSEKRATDFCEQNKSLIPSCKINKGRYRPNIRMLSNDK